LEIISAAPDGNILASADRLTSVGFAPALPNVPAPG
jgi:hypothetical protein